MPLTRVTDFGKLALALDPQPTMLEPGQWSKLQNIDVVSGDIRSCLGDSLLHNRPPIEPTYMHSFDGLIGTYLVISDGAQVYVFRNKEWLELTTAGTTPNFFAWDDSDETWDTASTYWDAYDSAGDPAAVVSGRVTFTVFLGTLVVVSTEGVPLYWPDELGKLTILPGWDSLWRCYEMHAFANHLVALGFDDQVTDGAKFRVAWSDAAAEGEVPQSWTPTPENLAGSVQLRDTDAYLTTAEIFGDNLAVYKKDSIYRMFLRGDEFVMGFERVISNHGCDSPDGVTALLGKHFFADSGDVRVFDGQSTKSITEFAVRSALALGVSDKDRDKTIVVAWPQREEVWIAVVPAGSDFADIVLIYSISHGGWTIKNYPETKSMIVGAYSSTAITDLQIWDDATNTWDTTEERWNFSPLNPVEDGMIFGNKRSATDTVVWGDGSQWGEGEQWAEGDASLWSGGTIIRVDLSNTKSDKTPKHCVAERTGFVIADLQQNVTLKAIYPEMEGDGTVQIQVGAQWHAGDRVRWTPPRDFRPGLDKKLNTRITGTPTALRVSSNSDNFWRLGAVSFLGVEASRR